MISLSLKPDWLAYTAVGHLNTKYLRKRRGNIGDVYGFDSCPLSNAFAIPKQRHMRIVGIIGAVCGAYCAVVAPSGQ